MRNEFRVPRSKSILVDKFKKDLATLLSFTAPHHQLSEEEKENDASYFLAIVPTDLTSAALEAGISLLEKLITLNKASPKNQIVFQEMLYLAQHLFKKAKDDIKSYQVTPAHAQLLAFNDTVGATVAFIQQPNSAAHGKKLDKSLKALQIAITKDSSAITRRLFDAVVGAIVLFLGVSICASTLIIVLASASPLTLTGIGTVASLILGGISGTLISWGSQLLRKAFAPRSQKTPQQLELLDCANTSLTILQQFAKNPATFFSSPQLSASKVQAETPSAISFPDYQT